MKMPPPGPVVLTSKKRTMRVSTVQVVQSLDANGKPIPEKWDVLEAVVEAEPQSLVVHDRGLKLEIARLRAISLEEQVAERNRIAMVSQ